MAIREFPVSVRDPAAGGTANSVTATRVTATRVTASNSTPSHPAVAACKRWAAIVVAAILPACSVSYLSFDEVERDLDAIVRLQGIGNDQRLVYADDAEQARWWARALLLKPIKPVLGWFFDTTSPSSLENPSGEVRRLLRVLAPKARTDLMAAASVAQRLGYVAMLDGSALNRIYALDGLAVLADAHSHDLLAGLERGSARLQPVPELPGWLEEFRALWPKGRQPIGRKLTGAQADRYRALLAAVTAQPLPDWRNRLGLVNSLVEAVELEPDPVMRAECLGHLRHAVRHVIQWAIVGSLQGQEPEWVEVRLRALELLHRNGGPDSVPLLLAYMSNSPAAIAAGESQFDPDIMMKLRLIHMCGQLDDDRARRSIVLPGREDWAKITPLDFLASIALDQDAFMSPLTLPAREALALCLGRARTDLYDDGEWVRSWYDSYRRGS